ALRRKARHSRRLSRLCSVAPMLAAPRFPSSCAGITLVSLNTSTSPARSNRGRSSTWRSEMSLPSTSSSRALSRGRTGLNAILSAGRSKSNRSTRIAPPLLLPHVRVNDLRRLRGRLAGCDLVDCVHSGDHAPDDRVVLVEAGPRREHDEELAVRAVERLGARHSE